MAVNDILNEIRELHAKKAADYGDTDEYANIRASVSFGVDPWVNAVIHASEKMQRIRSFITKGKLENEAVEDALIDMAAYTIIALDLWRNQFDAFPPTYRITNKGVYDY